MRHKGSYSHEQGVLHRYTGLLRLGMYLLAVGALMRVMLPKLPSVPSGEGNSSGRLSRSPLCLATTQWAASCAPADQNCVTDPRVNTMLSMQCPLFSL